jgi:two-component system, OmpR family, aerobic respiration control sensor histidine kinase ArcB
VHISASLDSRKKRHLIVNIAVRDSGTGIRLDKRDDIFLKFKRLTPSYEGIINGAGLGLTVVKKFIEEIGGEISLDDQISSGTKINCLLPLTAALIDDASGVENKEFKRLYKLYQKKFAYTLPNAHTKSAHTLCHVLLIEDQDLAAIAARTLLSKLACQVDLAKTGKSTMQLIQENRYDIIFIDIGLPDINGYELTRQIREYETNKHLSPTLWQRSVRILISFT